MASNTNPANSVSMISSVNASDVGLIVQGTLIFLGAVIGVLGYYVQARSARLARTRQLKLSRTREKLTLFVGPASEMAIALSTAINSLYRHARLHFPQQAKRFELKQKESGKTREEFNGGEWNILRSFVGKEIEAELIANPQHEFAKTYRLVCRAMMKIAVPLTELVKKYGGHLSEGDDIETFQLRFPCEANNSLLRHAFFAQLMVWTPSFEMLIEHCWDKGDLTRLFPACSGYPMQLPLFLVTMAGRVRQKENEYAIDDHAGIHESESFRFETWREEQIFPVYSCKGVGNTVIMRKGKRYVVPQDFQGDVENMDDQLRSQETLSMRGSFTTKRKQSIDDSSSFNIRKMKTREISMYASKIDVLGKKKSSVSVKSIE